MISQWWSFTIEAFGLIPVLMLSKKMRAGWLFYIAWMLLWIVYGWVTDQWGFVAASVIWIVLYARAWWLWRA